MAGENGNGAQQVEAAPALNALAQYIKDLSFEVPGAPAIFTTLRAAPRVDINLDVQARRVTEGQDVFEVTLQVRAEAHDPNAQPGESRVFLAELAYAGVFTLNGLPAETVATTGVVTRLRPLMKAGTLSLMRTPVASSLVLEALVTTSVYVTADSRLETILSPPVGVEVCLLIARSGRTTVDDTPALTQLLLEFGSPSSGTRPVIPSAAAPAGSVPLTQASLVTVPLAVARVVMVRRRNNPGSVLVVFAASQMTKSPFCVQLQPVPETPTKVSPLRRSMTRMGPVAARGPLLVTRISETISEPCATGFGDLVLLTRRSAPSGRTSMLTEPLLLPGVGSLCAAVMDAVLV